MKHVNYLEVEGRRVEEAGARGVVLRTVIGDLDKAPNFHMRVISFEEGGATPRHSHPWEHEVFILKGEGSVDVDGKTVALQPGDVVFVPPGSEHCFQSAQGMEML
ncbi:MAG: cupin domain-containing protein [Deltaproteobacteria bacterium]|nr:cupin domain-containing protein [Deltaproteobacteria bacterium]MDA8308176.1 cupin domain-containing protein [Deltaproteobacteria bacterium]